MGQLEDKTALITGGARGIGLAIGEALAMRGARVVLVDIAEGGAAAAAALSAKGLDAHFMARDITDSAAVETLLDDVIAAH